MLLIGVKENNGWLNSRWVMTYRVSWQQLLTVCEFVDPYYDRLEVLVDDKQVIVKNLKEYREIQEARKLTIRGLSKIIKVTISISFYNQLSDVDVNVAMANDEFAKADYEAFNKSLAQYLNSIEIAMHR